MKPGEQEPNTNSTNKPVAAPFVKVLDGRKQPIRGLWRRNDRFYAQLNVEDPATGGRRSIRRPLEALTIKDARQELEELRAKARSGELAARRKAPTLCEAIRSYEARLADSGKTKKTIGTEKGYLSSWESSPAGLLQVTKLRALHVRQVLEEYAKTHAPRSTNLLLVVLRNVLKDCVHDGYLASIPVDIAALKRRKAEQRERRLIHAKEIDDLCRAALNARFVKGEVARDGEAGDTLKNGQQFVDYVRLLQFTGAREKETLLTKWADINLHMGVLTIGANGGTKARKQRHVDIGAELMALLLSMKERRDPSSEWLFPSPQRGEADKPARTFRESLKLCLKATGSAFGFHDLRHYFVSHAVMAGIDFMTIARWVGHADGGVLIGKVYGHLAASHTKAMAARLSLSAPQFGAA